MTCVARVKRSHRCEFIAKIRVKTLCGINNINIQIIKPFCFIVVFISEWGAVECWLLKFRNFESLFKSNSIHRETFL